MLIKVTKSYTHKLLAFQMIVKKLLKYTELACITKPIAYKLTANTKSLLISTKTTKIKSNKIAKKYSKNNSMPILGLLIITLLQLI